MYRTKTKAVRRVAVATTMGLGLVGSVAGMAAASGSTSSDSTTTTTTAPLGSISGTVTGYVAGTSISVLSAGATAPVSYTLDASTTIASLVVGATAPAVGDTVTLMLSSATPAVVTTITFAAPVVVVPVPKIEGTVVGFVAGTSISVTTKDSTTPTVYALDANTAITGLSTGVTAPAVGDKVDLTLSSATPAVVTTIADEGVPAAPAGLVPVVPTAQRIEGTVTAFVAGTSISVMAKDATTATTATTYTLDANTTFTGLATGVTAPAIGDNVDLFLSTTTPIVVTTVKDETASTTDDDANDNQSNDGQGRDGHGNGGQGNSDHGNSGQGRDGHGNGGDHWNNSGSSASNFSGGGFNAGGGRDN